MKHARKDGLLPLHIAARTSSEHAAAVVSWLLTASLATHEVKYKEQARDRTLEELVAEGENSIARTEKKHHISFQTLTTAISGGTRKGGAPKTGRRTKNAASRQSSEYRD